MTDEQIKQNADNYTESLMCENLHRTMYSSIDFIAGAHSMDEEIEKLRNPWISVDDRLPEKAIGLYELEEDEQHKMVLIKTANGSLYSGYLDAEEIWRAFTVPYKGAYPIAAITWSRVTHWMPIPKLKGGVCMKK